VVVPGRPEVSDEDTARTVRSMKAGTSVHVWEMSVKARLRSDPYKPTGSVGMPATLWVKYR
jgi:hypothetical protein